MRTHQTLTSTALVFLFLLICTSTARAYYCYQETANKTYACGASNSGSYSVYSTAASCPDLNTQIDEDWTSLGNCYAAPAIGDIDTINITYMIHPVVAPENMGKWQFYAYMNPQECGGLDNKYVNITLNNSMQYDSTKIILYITEGYLSHNLEMGYYNSTGAQKQLYHACIGIQEGIFGFYEEGVYWNVYNDTNNPVVTLANPKDNINYNNTEKINFVCTVTDNFKLKNVTLHVWNSTSQAITNSSLISGTGNTSSFLFQIPNQDVYHWNCQAYDTTGNQAWHSTNYTFTYAGVVNCSPSETSHALNIANFEENSTSNPLSMNAEAIVTYWLGNNQENLSNYNAVFPSSTNISICIRPANVVFQSNVYVKYFSSAGLTQRYYLYNFTLSNSTQNINIYNHASSTGLSQAKVTARDKQTYNYDVGILAKLQRYYVGENLWRTVQMGLTDSYGLVTFNVKEISEDYRVTYTTTNNSPIWTSDTMNFICTSSLCDITFLLTMPGTTTTVEDVSVNSYYDNTTSQIITSWQDNTGSAITTTVLVTIENSTGSTPVCYEAATGTAGTFTCAITEDEKTYNVQFYTGTTSKPHRSFRIIVSPRELYRLLPNEEGYFWSFGLILTVIGFGLFSPAAAIITGVIALVFISYMGLVPFVNIPFIGAIALMGIAIAWRIKK